MKPQAVSRVALILLVGMAAASGQNSCTGKPQILVLGTYHMGNPGRDIYNMQVDDVRAPKRQQELAQLAEVLAKFQPTKIAVEADPDGKKLPITYQEYLAGKHELTANEVEQIGFRVGKQLGHKQLYAVDVDGEFPMQRVMDYAKANGRSSELEKTMAGIGHAVAKENEYVMSHTVLQTLLYMNAPEQVAASNNFYVQMVPYGEPGDFAGPDLLTSWYQRNIRIYSNIIRLISSPNERILVIYGSGHLPWLQENTRMDPNLCLRTLAEFAPAQ